jgi:hypothetical protein
LANYWSDYCEIQGKRVQKGNQSELVGGNGGILEELVGGNGGILDKPVLVRDTLVYQVKYRSTFS